VPRSAIIIAVTAAFVLSGCIGQRVTRNSGGAEEIRDDPAELRADVDALQKRIDSLESTLRAYETDRDAARVTSAVQIEQLQDEIRALSVQVQEMMNLVASRTAAGSSQAGPDAYAAPPTGDQGYSSQARDLPSWEPPAHQTAGSSPDELSAVDDAVSRAADGTAADPTAGARDGAGENTAAMQEPIDRAATSAPTTARELYDAAYTDLTRGNYQLALMGFRDYLKRYPDTDLADNAQYWIGEVYYAQSQYAQAIEEFLLVVDRYPGADKVAAAYLKTAFSFRRTGDLPTARRYLRLIMDRFPDSEEARLARQNLAELR